MTRRHSFLVRSFPVRQIPERQRVQRLLEWVVHEGTLRERLESLVDQRLGAGSLARSSQIIIQLSVVASTSNLPAHCVEHRWAEANSLHQLVRKLDVDWLLYEPLAKVN